MPSQKELHDFSDSLIAIHQRQANEMDIYADSLRMRNRELNRTLNKLINDLDEQAQTAFSQRELKMAEAEKMSFFLMAGVIGMAIILLIISHLIIMRDLNRRERDKAELEDTATQNRTLSDMRKKIIITLSHDIRGPLNAISGSAELAMDTRDRKRRNAYLGNILESSRHITRLANSLLDLSRLDDAKETLNEIPFHLESFLESIAEEYTRKANDKGLMFDKAFHVKRELGLRGGLLVTNPIPEEYSMDKEVIDKAIAEAVEDAKKDGIHGKATTPYLLAKIKDLTGGDSLDSNIQLVFNNARLGAAAAVELSKLEK